MEFVSLGRTGVQVSELCLGCMNFGNKTDYENSEKIMNHAIDAGINFFDTADCYGDSELFVGKALKANGKRNWIVLATKVFAHVDKTSPNGRGNHRRHITEGCENSLRRLQTDWLDVYYIHRPMPEIPIDETLRALDDLIRSGKVRYIGTSTFAGWQLMEALWVARELGLNRFVVEQPPYHLLDRRIENELLRQTQTYGTAVCPWSPLAGGFLSGKYERGATKESAEGRHGGGFYGNHFKDEAFDVMDVVREIADEKGCTPSQFALAWVAGHPGVTSPIIGPRTMEHLADNIGSVDVEVTDDDRERLDKVSEPGTAITPAYYNPTFFGPHKFRW